jgi:O-antigen/teichoic acid export membrane protein
LAATARRPGILRDNLVLFGLSMVVNVLGFAFQFVMARLLTPGAWAEMIAAISLLALLSVPGVALNSLVIKVSGDLFVQDRDHQLWRWLTRTAARVGVVGLAIAVALGLLSGWISDLLQFDGVASILVVGSAIVLSLVAIVVKGSLAGTSSFFFLGIISVAETASRLGAGAGMVLLGWAAAGAVAGSSVGAAVAVIGGAVILFRVTRRTHGPERMETQPVMAGRDQLRVVGIAFALAIVLNADILFVKAYFDDIQAANYSAVALIGRTLFFATSPVSIVLLPHVIRRYSSGHSIVPSLLVSVGLIAAIVTVVALTVLIFPTYVFAIAFPDQYDLNTTLLSIYIVAGTLLSLSYALAHLNIGAGNLRPWSFMLVAVVAMLIAMFSWHESVQDLATILTITLAATTVYLAVETYLLVRRPVSGRTAGTASK